MKVLVTGASGFVGLNVINALQEAGHESFAFVRKSSRTDFLNRFKTKIVYGDVLDYNSLLTALQGKEAVIHCAALTSGFRHDRQIQYNTNITGTQNVLNAALSNKVKRLIFTSSTCTIGCSKSGCYFSEEDALEGYRAKSQYAITKVLGEKIVLSGIDKGLEVIILNPAEVFGTYDYHFGWGILIVALSNKLLDFLPAGGGSFCHSLEVGRAHAAALTKGRVGQRYILAGTNIPYTELYDKLAAALGYQLPDFRKFTNSFFYRNLKLAYEEFVFPLTKKKPLIDRFRNKVFYNEYYFSCTKAVKELDFRPVPIEKMIDDCYSWYKENQIL